MTRSPRVLAILRVFVNGAGASFAADELAERFGCSVNAARRDVTALKAAGWIVSQSDDDDARRARYAVNPRYLASREQLRVEADAFFTEGRQ
jgi:DNA-binding IclR family transcriptional regulator